MTVPDGAVRGIARNASDKAGLVRLNLNPDVYQAQVCDLRTLKRAEKTRKTGIIHLMIAVIGIFNPWACTFDLQVQQGVSIAVKNTAEIHWLPGQPLHIDMFHQPVAARRILSHLQQLLIGMDFHRNRLVLLRRLQREHRGKHDCRP